METRLHKYSGLKSMFFLLAIALGACTGSQQPKEKDIDADTTYAPAEPKDTKDEIPTTPQPEVKVYANERFKEVTVQKTGDHQFLIQGKGQIFEANFSWVVEDGHEELLKGYQMTDAGAPEWGKFSFTVDVEKRRENSTLMLILFESSPKDGSRQYELPVVLY